VCAWSRMCESRRLLATRAAAADLCLAADGRRSSNSNWAVRRSSNSNYNYNYNYNWPQIYADPRCARIRRYCGLFFWLPSACYAKGDHGTRGVTRTATGQRHSVERNASRFIVVRVFRARPCLLWPTAPGILDDPYKVWAIENGNGSERLTQVQTNSEQREGNTGCGRLQHPCGRSPPRIGSTA